MVTPAAKREAVGHLAAAHDFSRRRSCHLLGVCRATADYRSGRIPPTSLIAAIRRHAAERPRFGYRRLRVLAARDGESTSLSRFYRIYRRLDLSVRRRPRKRLKRVARGPRPLAMRPNERWSMDFVGDTLVDRRSFRIFAVVDDYTRECVAVEVGDVLTSERVVRVLARATVERGVPASIVSDNGPEFTAARTLQWTVARGIQLDYIQPGCPTQNAYPESFNGRLRDECLNQHVFLDLDHAVELIEAWVEDYNRIRPHGSLGGRTPEEFASEFASTRPAPPHGAEQAEPVPTARGLT